MEYIKKYIYFLPTNQSRSSTSGTSCNFPQMSSPISCLNIFYLPTKVSVKSTDSKLNSNEAKFLPNQHNTTHHTKGQQWKRRGKKTKTNINENHTTKEKNIEKKCKGLFGNISIISPRDTQTLTTHHPIY